MNIFSALRIYAGKWSETSKRAFSKDEIAAVLKAEVVASQYGYSVCLYMVSGGQAYIPVDQSCSANEGDIIDLSKAELVTLSKTGENDIYRIRF